MSMHKVAEQFTLSSGRICARYRIQLVALQACAATTRRD
jgi:hypothetical protein